MRTQPYSELIFGGMSQVKILLVAELKHKRELKKLSPEELDKINNFGADWPTTRELEADPQLFTHNIYDRLAEVPLRLESENDTALVVVTGSELLPKINEYLKNPAKLDEVMEEFRSSVKTIRGTVWGPDPDAFIKRNEERILNGEPLDREFHVNSFPREFWATDQILNSILIELP